MLTESLTLLGLTPAALPIVVVLYIRRIRTLVLLKRQLFPCPFDVIVVDPAQNIGFEQRGRTKARGRAEH